MMRLPPRSTLLPCATLFGSHRCRWCRRGAGSILCEVSARAGWYGFRLMCPTSYQALCSVRLVGGELDPTFSWKIAPERSEEHTYELQSRQYLVCHPLLEQKQ